MKNSIEIQGLNKKYDSFSLDNVSFNVPAGSVVGFVGENGAGKTTTLKIIIDAVKKDSGTVKILGMDSTEDGVRAREKVGVVFDECNFHDWFTINHIAKFMSKIYKDWDDEYFNKLIKEFGMADKRGSKDILKTFSRGMKMKLSLAVALAHHPKVLILDEATSGLDPVVRDEILDMFLEFIQNEDCSILFSSHITSDIEKIADYVVFIHNGKIVMNSEKDKLLDNYGVLRCADSFFETIDKKHVKGYRKNAFGTQVLIDNRNDFTNTENVVVDRASIEDIMVMTIKSGVEAWGVYY